jgi:anti-anti-sigma regulatory factor
VAPIECSSVTFTRLAPFAGRKARGTIVWLRGVHDVSTMDALTEILALAIGLDDADLTLDLSRVESMAVATVGVIIRSRESLRSRSRSLALRSPSMCARGTLKQAGPLYGCVVGRDTTTALPGTAGALGTWAWCRNAIESIDALTCPR